ncbi:MAG: FAD-dependent oxidoreductase [Pseudomonadota bacterium]
METIGNDLKVMQRTPLSQEHIEALSEAGEIVHFAKDEMIAEIGDRMNQFHFVLEGEVIVVHPYTRERYLEASLGPGQFMGEIAFLSGGSYSLPMRALQPTKCIVVERKTMLDLMARIPEMSDVILTVFAARRRRQIEEADTSLRIVGNEDDRLVLKLVAFASRNRIPYHVVKHGSDEAHQIWEGAACPLGETLVVFGRDRVLRDPTPLKVAGLLGLDLDVAENEVFDTLIVGGGPAGVAAAVYAGAEGLKALVVEDIAIGGQAGTSSRIENYMGFPTGISGGDLVWRGEVQAMKFGTRFAMPRRVRSVKQETDGMFAACLDSGDREAEEDLIVRARSVIVATGVQYMRLPLDKLEDFEGAGIYYSATEVEARLCRNSEAIIVGGGNSAGQAAMFLSRAASHVHLLIRGNSLASSMSDYLSGRLEADPRITIHYNSQIDQLHGDDRLNAITVKRSDGRENWKVDTRAAFIMIGARPFTDWLPDSVKLDERAFVQTGEAVGGRSTYETSHHGIFAVGDVRAGSVKRVASSVGEGSVVISKVWEHVNG